MRLTQREMTKVFSKDSKLINDFRHENIIELLAVWDNPAAIMLELCEFSMKPFQGDQSFHSLDKFLKYLAKNELLDFFPGICDKITNDTLQSIFYIHSKNIVHRDIKPANILVNKPHYCNASQEDAIHLFRKNPLTCKLADLAIPSNYKRYFQRNEGGKNNSLLSIISLPVNCFRKKR